MFSDDTLILRGDDVGALLREREAEIIRTVRQAYQTHAQGESGLPQSNILRFPAHEKNRIIALPAFLGGEFAVAGIKWVASFPDNITHGLDRASATIILNSAETGRPLAIIEGSIISAKRTAASAALAAQHLHAGGDVSRIGMIGGGLINFEVVRFLLNVFPHAARFVIFDLDPERAQHFKYKCERKFEGVKVEVASSIPDVLSDCPVVSFATTAVTPHVDDLSVCRPGSTILHVSLRDLTPEAILACDNVVDDPDHVCRARTSVHLAEQLTGNRDFIRCSLSDILNGSVPARAERGGVTVFSPFGLGVLDLAVAKRVYELGRERELGTLIESFLPDSWVEKEYATSVR